MKNQTLIITEKPDSARRIALALDLIGKPKKTTENGISYYIARRDREIVIVPAIGHLYTVAAKKSEYIYPIFEFEWKPRFEVEKKTSRIKSLVNIISKLSKKADKFIDACDYDIEGSIIGYTVLKYACKNKEKVAKRMKYSTLTKEEILKAYNNLSSNLDFSIIESGLARHEIDWLYGINLSRALTLIAKKSSGTFTKLSIGRVQGPTLNFLEKREIALKTYIPIPYWELKAKIRIGEENFIAEYEKKIKKKTHFEIIKNNILGKKSFIEKVRKNNIYLVPPFPFYLGSLQREVYKIFKITPRQTAQIAQRLYLEALISYPRTSSQKLPRIIGYRTILEKIGCNPNYNELTTKLLSKNILKPNEGPKEDSAHPAIFPTGKKPERALTRSENKVLDLIIKRFLSVFSDVAEIKKTKAEIKIDDNLFFLTGSQIKIPGWIDFYKPYIALKNKFLPLMEINQKVDFIELIPENKFTKPPSRYNPSALLQKMEQENIGTKATRSEIIKKLTDRKYIYGEKIEVSELGFEVLNVLEKYSPNVVSIELTRKIEKRMEEIKQNKKERTQVIMDSITLLKETTNILKDNEELIGKRLSQGIRKIRIKEKYVGRCLSCGNGDLLILRSKKTHKRFVGCTNYFEGSCKTSYPLPQQGIIRVTNRSCKPCGSPIVKVINKGKRTWDLCLNPICPTKKR